jgi:hypothetical protein
VSYFNFLTRCFDNVAYWDEVWSPRWDQSIVGGWRFRRLKDVDCIGASFDQLKADATTVNEIFHGDTKAIIQAFEAEVGEGADMSKILDWWNRRKAAKAAASGSGSGTGSGSGCGSASSSGSGSGSGSEPEPEPEPELEPEPLVPELQFDELSAVNDLSTERSLTPKGPMFATPDECLNGTQRTRLTPREHRRRYRLLPGAAKLNTYDPWTTNRGGSNGGGADQGAPDGGERTTEMTRREMMRQLRIGPRCASSFSVFNTHATVCW